ncbi:MAG: haloacid dehalogenase [Armatimonadota bacterium]
MDNLSALVSAAREELEVKHSAREVALAHGRTLVRTCANAIRAMHRGELDAAGSAVDGARAEASRVRDALADHPDLLHAGYVQDAHKELAEAACLLAMLRGDDLPSPAFLGIAVPAWCNGLAEAASEGRRHALDRLRRDDLDGAERMLGRMDDILSELTTIDFPDAVTDGLRRTCDALRAVVERTRGDVTLAAVQTRTRHALEGRGTPGATHG